ncbi:MAG: hypothetical protein ACRC6H_06615 [Culicoidibacterales bacterium]
MGPKILENLHKKNQTTIKLPTTNQMAIITIGLASIIGIFQGQLSLFVLFIASVFASLNAWNDWKEQAVFDILTFVTSSFAIVYIILINSDLILVIGNLSVLVVISSFAKKLQIIRSGDILFLISCSLLIGGEQIGALLILTTLLGGCYGFFLFFNRRLHWQTTIPLTPWMLLATLIINFNK